MDSYSQIIISAVDKLRTPVVKIEQFDIDKGRETVTGTGTGFLFSSDGYLFTNSHVVKKAKQLRAILYDGSIHNATLIGILVFAYQGSIMYAAVVKDGP